MSPLEQFITKKDTYNAQARQLAIKLANTKNADPGAIAYKANVITIEELTGFCLNTILCMAQEQANMLSFGSEALTYDVMAAMYSCTKKEAEEWIDDIMQRSLHHFTYTYLAKKQ